MSIIKSEWFPSVFFKLFSTSLGNKIDALAKKKTTHIILPDGYIINIPVVIMFHETHPTDLLCCVVLLLLFSSDDRPVDDFVGGSRQHHLLRPSGKAGAGLSVFSHLGRYRRDRTATVHAYSTSCIITVLHHL